MMRQAAAAIQCSRALYLPLRAGIRSAPPFRWPAVIRGIRHPNVMAFTLAAVGFTWAAAALGVMSYQQGRQDTAVIEPGRNETIVFRREEQQEVEVSDDQESDGQTAPLNYARVVRTLRFLNPDALASIGTTRERVAKGRPSTINARLHGPTDNFTYAGQGVASWYGPDFHGRLTANGERYDMNGISAAHRTMPLPSYARVTNLDNGRSIIVRVNNRGPYVHNRIVDLSTGAARALDFYKQGTARVRVEFVGRAPIEGSDDQMLLATLRVGTPAPAPASLMVASAKPFLGKDDAGGLRSPTER
jgi:rare lipoprotein A (peptidoglycan hydrolase)